MTYSYCFVPCCKNSSVRTPNKLFIAVPRSEPLRTEWMNAVRRDLTNDPVSAKSGFKICEDHFDLENDVKNYRYVQYFKAQGKHVKVHMKPGILPTKLDCQIGRQATARKDQRITERRENLSQIRTKLEQSNVVRKNLASSDGKSMLSESSCSTEEGKQIIRDVQERQDDPNEDILGKCEELILPVTQDTGSCVQDVIFFVDDGARKNDFRVENEFDFLEPLQPLDDPFYNCEYSSEDESNKEDPLDNNVPTKNDSSDNEIDRKNDEANEEPERVTDSEKEDDDDATDEDQEEEVESSKDDDKEFEKTQDGAKEDTESPSDKVVKANDEIERASDDERVRIEIEKANDCDEEDYIRGRGDGVGEVSNWDSDGSYEEQNYSEEGSNGEEGKNSGRRSGSIDSESDLDGFEEDKGVEGRLEEEENDRSSEKDEENSGDNKYEYEEKHIQRKNKLSKHNLNGNSSAEEHSHDNGDISEEGHLKENPKRKRTRDSDEDDPVAGKKTKLAEKELKTSWKQRRRAYEDKLHPSFHMAFLDDWGPNHTYVTFKKDEPEDCDVNILYEEIEIDDDDESIVPEANGLQGSDINREDGSGKIDRPVPPKVPLVEALSSTSLERKFLIIDNGKLKVVVQPPPGNGPSLLKSTSPAAGERAKPVTSLLTPVLSMAGSRTGTFIKLSDIQNISGEKVSESPSLKILVSSGTSPSQTNIKVLQRTPASGAQSGGQKTLKVIPKSLISSQTNLRAASLLKSSPILLTASQSSDSESQKLIPMTKSPHNIGITPKQDPAELRCEFCKIVFLKASSLEIHQKARHSDQLKARAAGLKLGAISQYSPTTSQASGPTTTQPKFITLPTNKIITLPSTSQQKIVTLPTASQQKLIALKQTKPVLPNISQHNLVNGAVASPKGRPPIIMTTNQQKLIALKRTKPVLPNISQHNLVISKNSIPSQKKPQNEVSQTDSHENTNPVTLPDLLELERELKGRAGNCDSCLRGKWVVSDLKKHARRHPYGEENCLVCKRSILFHRKYMSHLESHAPDSIESLSDSDEPE